MTQQNTTTNFLIQGHNGQMVKLIQATKPISGIITTSMSGQPVKIFKTGVSSPETSQGTQIIRTLSLPPTKIVTKPVPIHVGNLPKVTTKTIKITPSQIQSFKMLHTTPKLQTVSGPLASTISGSQGTKIMSPHILSRKRMDPLELDYTPETKRARKSEKVGKGLRHFSMKVCEKVKQKGTTTYNEVADELVGEFTRSSSPNTLADQYDQKNIRRRVYDALNVLMAMNIISKEKKEIRWIGLPTNSFQECHQLQRKIEEKEKSIKLKQNQLNDLILNQIAFKNLAQRNRETEKAIGPPPINSYIQLPFLVVNTNKKAVINCSISNDKMEYLFQFSDRFEINDDLDILKSIGMLKGLHTGDCTPEDLESIKSLVPQSLWPYVDNIASGKANENTASSSLQAEDFVEATIDEESSRPSSSFDPLSPSVGDYSDEELESDISSETELN